MSELTAAAPMGIELYALSEPPDAREYAVLEAQTRRVAAMLLTEAGPPGSLFAIEPQAYASRLDRLADEGAP